MPLFSQDMSYGEARQKLVEAFGKKDYPAVYQWAKKAKDLKPTHVGALYNMALACALTDRVNQGLALFNQLADMGLFYNLEAQPAFKPLLENKAYPLLVARFEQNKKPVMGGKPAFNLLQKDLFPEGIARDERSGTFYISSVHHRKIVRFDSVKGAMDWVPEARDGLWSVLGIQTDSERRRLWVCSAAMDQTKNLAPEDKGKTGAFLYDLDSGRLTKKFILNDQEGPHSLGDLVLGDSGDVFLTDGTGGAIYYIAEPNSDMVLFHKSELFHSPQGICLSQDGSRLYVADYRNGILSVNLADKTVTVLDTAKPMALNGIDGMVRYKNRLIGIQNGIRPHRVVSWQLDEGGRRIESERILESNLDLYQEPTLGTVVGDRFLYVATSQWNRYDKEQKPLPMDQLSEIQIREIPLSDSDH